MNQTRIPNKFPPSPSLSNFTSPWLLLLLHSNGGFILIFENPWNMHYFRSCFPPLPSPPRAFQPPDRTSNIGPWPISFRGNNVLFRFRIIKRKFICAASFPHRKLNHREICHAGKKRVPAIKCELSFVRNGRRVINIFDGGGRRGRKKKSGAKTEKCKPSN